MAARKPVVFVAGKYQQLQAGDTIDASCNEVDIITLENEEGADAIVKGMAVYISSAGKVKKAKADAVGTRDVIALCLTDSVAAGQSGSMQTDGQITIADWTAVIGAAALVAGSLYYLSEATSGKLTATPPATGSVVEIGIAISTVMMDINIKQPILL